MRDQARAKLVGLPQPARASPYLPHPAARHVGDAQVRPTHCLQRPGWHRETLQRLQHFRVAATSPALPISGADPAPRFPLQPAAAGQRDCCPPAVSSRMRTSPPAANTCWISRPVAMVFVIRMRTPPPANRGLRVSTTGSPGADGAGNACAMASRQRHCASNSSSSRSPRNGPRRPSRVRLTSSRTRSTRVPRHPSRWPAVRCARLSAP